MSKTVPAENMLHDFAAEVGAASVANVIVLPGSGVTIKDTAAELFKRIGLKNTMFIRGGTVTHIVQDMATSRIEVISPAAARSLFESYGEFWVRRAGRGGEQVLQRNIIAQDMAAALLETEEARAFLPQITGLINCPVIVVVDGKVQTVGKGFHPETGLFVTDGLPPEEIDLSEATAMLKHLVDEFEFQSPGDRSRALASFITPALKLGGLLHGNVPADVAEADQSQAGKTFRQKLIAAVYNEHLAMVTCRKGGVGSVDESLNAQLIAGRPFIQLDNFRGKFDSPHTEALMTAEKSFPVRVPHCREVMIDPSRFFVMLTSNGVETTRDFANRSSIVRIRKREGHVFRQYGEGDLLDHVRAYQPKYLGAAFAVVREWIERGRPRTKETRHDFREWAQSLDWIVQNILGEAPLMDGHQAAQERVSNPDLTFLRKLALAVADQNLLGEWFNASALYGIADGAGIDIPGLRDPDEEKGKRVIGTVMARLFKTASMVVVDAYTVTRNEEETPRTGGGSYPAKKYIFERTTP